MGLLVAVCGAFFGLGLLLLTTSWLPAPPKSVGARSAFTTANVTRALAGLLGGLIVLLLTGWIVGLIAGMIGGWAVAGWWSARRNGSTAGDQERIEALASWCEQLRDLLSADNGVVGTISATVATCPAAIRSEVTGLVSGLARQDPAIAVRRFAQELNDPMGDLVASVLLLSLTRTGRTSELLSELAETARARGAMRVRVESERAGQRGEARFVVLFVSIVMIVVTVFGHGSRFLKVYDTASGQLVLAMICVMFVGGIAWLLRLTRFEQSARFLAVDDLEAVR